MARTLEQFKSVYAPGAEVVHLRNLVAELEAKVARLQAEKGEVLELTASLTKAIAAAKPQKIVYRPSTAKPESECTHVLHLTDLHIGEVVRPDEVDGFGAYSPAISRMRLAALGQHILDHTETMRKGYCVPHLHILGTGDYISGDIHEELRVTNAFPAPVQAVEAGYMLGELVAALAPHFASVTCDMLTLDNHGRMTRKPQASEGGENNWGYVVAHIMRQYLSNHGHVEVRIHAKPSALVAIGPERYLMMHGHQIRGWAGKPYYGFDRRVAMEAVKRMGVAERSFTKLLLGHFHTATNDMDWMLGGSLSGTNAYDHSCGRHAQPHQTSWYVHQVHGEFSWQRWWL